MRSLPLVLPLLLWASEGRSSDFVDAASLSLSHAALEGLQHCTACHPSGKKLSREACLVCHREVATATKGPHRVERKAPCETCHLEHQGGAKPVFRQKQTR
jgi:hypothetical protein